MAFSVYSWNSVTLPRCLNLMILFVTFSQHIRYFLISTKLFPITDLSYFVLLCFVLLSTSRIPFICMLDLFSNLLICHLLYLFSSACPFPLYLYSFLKTVFHIINFVFGLWILSLITLIYLLVLQWYYFCFQFLSSPARSPFISLWCLIILSLISSFIVSLLIVVCNFLLLFYSFKIDYSLVFSIPLLSLFFF